MLWPLKSWARTWCLWTKAITIKTCFFTQRCVMWLGYPLQMHRNPLICLRNVSIWTKSQVAGVSFLLQELQSRIVWQKCTLSSDTCNTTAYRSLVWAILTHGLPISAKQSHLWNLRQKALDTGQGQGLLSSSTSRNWWICSKKWQILRLLIN